LIKHKDDWAGEVDITEFAPKSVKSEGDFEDILAADRPDVWESNRPAKGGEAGTMLSQIIDRAARLKAGSARVADRAGVKEEGKAPAARASGRRAAPRSGARERAASGGRAPRPVRKAVKKADRTPRTGKSMARKRKP
jgi:hypothetical protein